MPQKYLHYFGNESSESILQAYGIMPKDQQIDQLRPKQCPNCNEPNKPVSKFCVKCRLVLTYDAYQETIEEKQRTDAEVFLWKNKYLQDVTKLIEQMKDMKELQEETRRELGEIKRSRASLIHS
jgi:integrase/recombinase XerD